MASCGDMDMSSEPPDKRGKADVPSPKPPSLLSGSSRGGNNGLRRNSSSGVFSRKVSEESVKSSSSAGIVAESRASKLKRLSSIAIESRRQTEAKERQREEEEQARSTGMSFDRRRSVEKERLEKLKAALPEGHDKDALIEMLAREQVFYHIQVILWLHSC